MKMILTICRNIVRESRSILNFITSTTSLWLKSKSVSPSMELPPAPTRYSPSESRSSRRTLRTKLTVSIWCNFSRLPSALTIFLTIIMLTELTLRNPTPVPERMRPKTPPILARWSKLRKRLSGKSDSERRMQSLPTHLSSTILLCNRSSLGDQIFDQSAHTPLHPKMVRPPSRAQTPPIRTQPSPRSAATSSGTIWISLTNTLKWSMTLEKD